MEAGDTFLMGSPGGKVKHLHIILGFFDTHHPIVINTTSPENRPRSETFFLTNEDHDWLTDPRSILAYDMCRTLEGYTELQQALDAGTFVIPQKPLNPALLREVVKQTLQHPDTPRIEKKRLQEYYAGADWL
jgi:hypothetical protein